VTPALSHLRICDFTGQLAGAGATRVLAAFGAQVIRIEDPATQGRWDMMRGIEPFVDDRRGNELGGAYNNHNVEKLAITLDMKSARGRELLGELVRCSDVVTENFTAGVFERWGFPYERLEELRPGIIYAANCGFGHTGPYAPYRTWGPVVQAFCGLTFSSGLPGHPSAGWGYSYMDHHGGTLMALAILAALVHRHRTGAGQYIDMSCVEGGAALLGPAVLDGTVNGRPLRRAGSPDSNHSRHPARAPHNVYPSRGDDEWIAIACRDDADWSALVAVIDEEWARAARWQHTPGRLADQPELDRCLGAWTCRRDRFLLAHQLRAAGVPAAAVRRPEERIEDDDANAAWGLWPEVEHAEIGRVRVDGVPIHLSETDWRIRNGAPLLGRHNDLVYGELLGLSSAEIASLRAERVI
jgi:crotonobetainyl-CoA:carnitine CoA-transferase CaiB-like acyl-CoA transferase